MPTAPRDMAVVAFATKGLEDVTADEIREVLGAAARVVETRAKHVRFVTSAPLTALRGLATVDDLAFLLTEPLSVQTRADLDRALTGDAAFDGALAAIGSLRPLDGTFSVTVTTARSPLGGTAVVRDVAATAIASRLGWKLRRQERAPVDLRVFLDGTFALLGLRVFDAPLTQRDYRRVDAIGSLRPTVAAAMVRLTCGSRAPREVWDPFCGSGTVLAECALAGHRVAGTDIAAEAVAAARANLSAISSRLATVIELGDSAALSSWRRHANADTVLTNMPWGKQVSLSAASALYEVIGIGIADLAARGGRAGVLTIAPDRLAAAVRRAGGQPVVLRRRIGLLGQSPSFITFGGTGTAPAGGDRLMGR